MLRRTFPQVIAIVLSLSAAYFSFNLLAKHIHGSSGLAWFETTCESNQQDHGGANCDAVLATPWSYVPPKYKDDPADKYVFHGFKFQFPAAFLGMVYYSVLAVWFVGIGSPSRSRRWILFLPAVVVLLGLASSVFFSYLMFFSDIEEWCPWCMVTHVLNLLIAGCLVLMWPRNTEPALSPEAADPPQEPSESAAQAVREIAHPSGRLTLITVVAIAVVAFGQLQLLGKSALAKDSAVLKSQLARLTEEVRQIRQDGDELFRKWRKGERHEISIRPDDPVRRGHAAKRPPLTVVLFSDLECPACKTFAEFLEEKVQPLFDGNLAVVFKHYPLDSECNPHIGRKVHPNACYALRLAEGARLLKGNQAFWQVHDFLHENLHQLRHEGITPEQVAGHLGLGLEPFLAAINAEGIEPRIVEDCNQGKKLGIRGTPTPFVGGKQVGYLYMREINFWDRLADAYWRSLKVPRPETAKLYRAKRAPSSEEDRDIIPDNQDPTTAP